MESLRAQLSQSGKRASVIADSEKVLDQEVADKGGLTGIAVKGGYKIVQSIKPGFVREAIDALLDEFLDALDPCYQEAIAKGVAPGKHLEQNSARVADALLSVTDRRAEQASSSALRKAYDKLRPMAKKQVEAAIPRLGQMVERHAATQESTQP
jgi:hypothetical protein